MTDNPISATPDRALRALASLLPSPVIALDRDGRTCLWNEAAEILFGWKQNEVLGLHLPVIEDQERIRFAESLARALLQPNTEIVTAVWRTKSGEFVEVGFHIAEWNGPEGAAMGFLLVVMNLSEQKRAAIERTKLHDDAAHARAEAETFERFREIVEAAPDAIVKVDASGRIVLVNRTTETLFGY